MYNLIPFLKEEYQTKRIWPKPEDTFKAYELCEPYDAKVVIIGQDPYPNAHAHGLSFSTTQPRRPVSLNYIFKEIRDNYPHYEPEDFPTNTLTSWAEQGVFLLNAVLTVQEGIPNSHMNKGWEFFTQATIRALFGDKNPKVFMLWGRNAEKLFLAALPKQAVPTMGGPAPIHLVLTSGHPAAAAYGKNLFSGNGHFKKANEFLRSHGRKQITWSTK